MANLARALTVIQVTLGGAAVIPATSIPKHTQAVRAIANGAWTYGDSVATCLFPVNANTPEDIPVSDLRGIYFAGTGTLTLVCYQL